MTSEYVLNTWYPLAWSRDIVHSLSKRRIVGKDLVLYRDSADKVVVHLDMCPHRMLPLSQGKLKGDILECGYHGMQFDCSGKCVRVPSQGSIPPNATIATYPTHENMGLVWVWMGTPALADHSKIYDLPQYYDSSWSAVEGDALEIGCHYLNLADNLCDPAHVNFVHLTTLGSPAGEDVPVHYEKREGELVTWRWINDAPAIPLFQKFRNFDGNVDRWHYYHYHAPSIAVVDFGSAPTGTGAQGGNRSNCIQVYACHFLTPVDEDTTIDHWLYVRNFMGNESVNNAMSAEFRSAFLEDKVILESIHLNEKKYPEHRPLKLAIDASPMHMRKMVKDLIQAETRAKLHEEEARA